MRTVIHDVNYLRSTVKDLNLMNAMYVDGDHVEPNKWIKFLITLAARWLVEECHDANMIYAVLGDVLPEQHNYVLGNHDYATSFCIYVDNFLLEYGDVLCATLEIHRNFQIHLIRPNDHYDLYIFDSNAIALTDGKL